MTQIYNIALACLEHSLLVSSASSLRGYARQCSPQDYFKAYGPAQLSRHFMYVLLLHALQYIGGLLISDIMHSKGISIKQTVYSVTLIL